MKKKNSYNHAKMLLKAQQVFNRFVRVRDEGKPCIACNTFQDLQAGHYVPQKGGSLLRYHEDNVNGECARCNGFDAFHLVGYRKNLINRIGLERVEWLEANRHTVKKWTRQELEQIIEKYGNR